MNNTKKPLGYATTFDDGVNYREIANIMTQNGFPMGHSSARNYVLRAMKHFAIEFHKYMKPQEKISEQEIDKIVHDPRFQNAIVELLQYIEV